LRLAFFLWLFVGSELVVKGGNDVLEGGDR
jgi:hypothetical protein